MHQELPEAREKPAIQWVSARHLQYMVTRAESAGVNMDTLLAEAGLVRARLPDVNYQVPVNAVEYLLANAHLLRQPGQPSAVDMPIGLLMAREIQPATFGAIGLIAQACASFADVLDILTRFNGLLSNIGRTTVIHKPGTVSLCWECTAGGTHFRRHTADYVLAAFVTLCRLLMSGQKLNIDSVHFAYGRPADARTLQAYADVFQAPLHFDSTMACVVMPASMLQMPLCHGDALLKDTLERHAEQTLQLMQQRSPRASLIDEVTHLIRAMMIGQVPDKDAIARQLGISSRSLHRRLQANGTRYRDLLDQVRLTVAQERLTDSTSPLARWPILPSIWASARARPSSAGSASRPAARRGPGASSSRTEACRSRRSPRSHVDMASWALAHRSHHAFPHATSAGHAGRSPAAGLSCRRAAERRARHGHHPH